MTENYPIDPLLPKLRAELKPGSIVLLQAPPGAGKTTRVPLALIGTLGVSEPMQAPEGRIWMIEPRRLATRAAATRLAETLGERVGERIGFSIRGEQRRSARTQVEVITDGLFLRRLQTDPSLQDVSCVLFDEFHERRRDADLALALLREARRWLRPDLPILLMSATLDLSDLRERLPEAVVLESEGRSFPVLTHHQPPRTDEPLPRQVLRAVEQHALSLPTASTVLVFLPGIAEIQRCFELLKQVTSLQDWDVRVLHGQLTIQEQNRCLDRCHPRHAGRLILSTAIAESSLTLDGVRLVIDSGLSRRLRYDPNTGMEGLETVSSSLASADQRRGRAGRQAPGACVRLWSPANQQRRPAFSSPELQLSDPQPIVMELATWGAGLGEELPWLDAPPMSALLDGRDQLQALHALTPEGRLSTTGRHLGGLGVHPRLGLLMLEAWRCGEPELGCDLAALLSERDPLPTHAFGCDLEPRLRALRNQPNLASLRQLSRQLLVQLQRLNLPRQPKPPPASAAELILAAFPQWLALKRPGKRGRFVLRQGRGARLLDHDPLMEAKALAVARVDLGKRETHIQLALPLSRLQVEELADRDGFWDDRLQWDSDAQRIRSERELRLGELVIRRDVQPAPSSERCRDLLIAVLRERNDLSLLPWTDRIEQLRRRLDLAHQRLGDPWPPCDPVHLLKTADHWLGPALEGCLRWREIDPMDLEECLWSVLDWEQRQQLDQWLPTHSKIPSGRTAPLRYEAEGDVVLAVKLQEMFGALHGPSVLRGQLKVTLELLSPAGRPLQRTQELSRFWNGSYQDVRREMRGRYPKHPWPENPLEARPTAATKQRSEHGRRDRKHTG